ncbi:MAG: CBS domain-containing protein [Spirochaetales bacterium]|nr:CBS domain-containing protein [Spirochaetales bacterium]MCF7938527.1 CBS domain-containing protein [Spirochaetales bacterium]
MQVKDILKVKGEEILKVGADQDCMEAVRVMNEKKVGALVAVDAKGELAGIITERDVMRKLSEGLEGKKVSDLMTSKNKLIIAHRDDSLQYVMGIFTANRIRHLPVFDKEKLVGIISIGDAVKEMLEEAEVENKHMMDYIVGSYPA